MKEFKKAVKEVEEDITEIKDEVKSDQKK